MSWRSNPLGMSTRPSDDAMGFQAHGCEAAARREIWRGARSASGDCVAIPARLGRANGRRKHRLEMSGHPGLSDCPYELSGGVRAAQHSGSLRVRRLGRTAGRRRESFRLARPSTMTKQGGLLTLVLALQLPLGAQVTARPRAVSWLCRLRSTHR